MRSSAAQEYDSLTVDTIQAALSYISADCDRETWFTMACAVKSELGQAGFSIWNDWSKTGASYNLPDAKDTWKSAKASGKITIGTLIYAALQSGFKFDSKPHEISDEERAARKAKREAEAAREQAALARKQSAAAQAAQRIWENAAPIAYHFHPYHVRKSIMSAGDVRVGDYPRWTPDGEIVIPNALLIPLRNKLGELTSLQAIFAETVPELGRDRDYLPNGVKQGSFFTLGEETLTIFLCEGYATGCTIHEATEDMVFVAFDRSNLAEVGKVVRELYPNATIVIAADNDKYGKRNDGLESAKTAAHKCQGLLRVPQFKDESTKPTDFNDLEALEGLGEVVRQLKQPVLKPANDNAPIPEPEPEPEPKPQQNMTLRVSEPVDRDHGDEHFRILGHDRGTFYFFQYGKKQVIELTPGQLTETGLILLARENWWAMNFPKTNGGFTKSAAVDWLVSRAYDVGIYDPTRVRGRGAWIDDGRVVFHFGSHVWVDGEIVDVTQIKSRYVYELGRTLPGPASTALTEAEGQKLQEISRMFRWTKPASAALLAGFVALAPLCGALRWRPHIWITGGAGCGKSTVLNDFVHPLMGGMDIFAQGNSTEAGIRQSLGMDALPVLFDEAEQNNDREQSRVQNVLSLIRQASSESAATTLKGTAGGDAMRFIVRSMFCLSSIQVGIKHQADRERLTMLALRPKRDDVDADNTWKNLSEALYWVQRDETIAERLFRRSIELLPTTMKNIKTFVSAATRKFGSVREGDQYGTLLAGYWSLSSRAEATPEDAAKLIDSFDWEEYREELDIDESSRALGALMECKLDVPQRGKASVFEIVQIADGEQSTAIEISMSDADALLQRYGMRVDKGKFIINPSSPSLTKLMSDTPYSADIKGQLLRVKGIERMKNTVRINGMVSRCLSIDLGIFRDPPAPGQLGW